MKTLAEHVAEAVPLALEGETALSFAAIWEKLPQHVLVGQPTQKSVKAAIAAQGWTLWRRGEGDVVYRAPRLQSDPLVNREQEGGNVTAEELRLLIERAERLDEEIAGLRDDRKDVLAEAKSRGFDTKAIRKIIAIRKKAPDDYREEETILETYLFALGMA